MKKPLKQTKTQKSEGKKKYRVRNWKEYNESLVNRGKIMFWVSEDALKAWEEKKRTGKRGKPKLFSSIAIETALTLREVFRLPLRQTEGFLRSILGIMGAMVKAPDYSTLSLRAKTLSVSIRMRPLPENIHIAVDSTGAKVYGEGEWKVRQHGWSKRRTWRKIHVGVDEKNGDIILGEVTGNDTADCEMFSPLLQSLPPETKVEKVSADGAYDKGVCYEDLLKLGVKTIAIPPQINARIKIHGNSASLPIPRDQNLRRIRKIGRKQWKKEVGYHLRSIAENTMFRLKTIFTDKVRSVAFACQRTEILLRLKALNRMSILGMPEAYVVA